MSSRMTFDELKTQLGIEPFGEGASEDAKLQHVLHAFEGYIAWSWDHEPSNPYAEGTARHNSWRVGSEMAISDFNANEAGAEG